MVIGTQVIEALKTLRNADVFIKLLRKYGERK